jgi:hypothetical protein
MPIREIGETINQIFIRRENPPPSETEMPKKSGVFRRRAR